MSRTIQAAVARGATLPWTIEELELSDPRADEIVVRMVGVGICHTDISVKAGLMPVPLPIVLGHEGAGVVEAVGSKVSTLKVGDHVVLSFDSCGHCRSCKHHNPGYCFEFFPRNMSGSRFGDGSKTLAHRGEPMNSVFFSQSSFATYAIAREANAVAVAKDLPLELLGPLGCGIQTGAGAAVNSLAMSEGDTLAIFGGGAVGLSALLGARAVNAGAVVVVEPTAGRRQLALELGATHVIDPTTTTDVLGKIRELTGGVNFAFDTTGIPAVVGVAVETLLPGGTLGMVGGPPPDAMLPANMMSMLVRGVTVRYIIEGDSDPKTFIPKMLAWYREGKFPFDKMIRKFAFEDINQAAHAAEVGEVIKPVLTF